jgi:hypothetical protein
MMKGLMRLLNLIVLACSPLAARAAPVPPPADPITATIQTEDADRFATMFATSGGKPTAEQIQRDYLDLGSYGIDVFTPDRIKNATALAAEIAINRKDYEVAIAQCLPIVKQAAAELRSIYLGLRGLYPARPLPQIYIVFGRGTSGGTAGPGAQVLGLEVLCKTAPTPEKLRQTLRMFFAHETVHTWQRESTGKERNPLLRSVLQEGAADYVASLVLGAPPSAEREAFAPQRESELWKQFEADVAVMRDLDWFALQKNKDAQIRMHRWVENYGSAPKDWPFELGYWIGMRTWQRYVDTAPDKHVALEEILTSTDANAVLDRGRYRP